MGNKSLEEIQLIVTSIEVANLAKRTTGVTTDLAMMAEKNQLHQAAKARSNKEYFHCGKKDHDAGEFHSAPKGKPEDEKAGQEAKQARWEKNRAADNKANTARSIVPDDDSDNEPYPVGRAFIPRAKTSG